MSPSTRASLLRASLVLLFGFAAGLGVLAFQRWEGAADTDLALEELERRLTAEPEPAEAGDDPPGDAPGEALRGRVAERYVFAPRPEDRFRKVRGVLGNRVLFEGGESAAVGEEYDGAEVVRVGAESVRFRKDGEEVTVRVGGGGGGGGEARSGRRRGGRGRGPGRGGGRPDGGRRS